MTGLSLQGAMALNSPGLSLGFRALALRVCSWRQREDFQLVGFNVKAEFKTTDVAAVDNVRPRQMFALAARDGRPTRGTMPRHGGSV